MAKVRTTRLRKTQIVGWAGHAMSDLECVLKLTCREVAASNPVEYLLFIVRVLGSGYAATRVLRLFSAKRLACC